MSQIDQPQSAGVAQSADVSSSGQMGQEARPGYRSSEPLAGTAAQAEQPTAAAGTSINGGQQGSAQPGLEPIGSGVPDSTGAAPSHTLLPNAEPFGAVGNPRKWVSWITPSKPSRMPRPWSPRLWTNWSPGSVPSVSAWRRIARMGTGARLTSFGMRSAAIGISSSACCRSELRRADAARRGVCVLGQ